MFTFVIVGPVSPSDFGVKLHSAGAQMCIPDGSAPQKALSRTTHMGIGAHSDDLEFMAYHGIWACHDSPDHWFCGVTCTDGAGSVRVGPYAHLSDAELVALRAREQNDAAKKGSYGAMVQLGHSSPAVRDPSNLALRSDLVALLLAAQPQTVYMHNLADKQGTHVAVAVATLQALRALPAELRPVQVWGCEVWRDLDWLPDSQKVSLDVTGGDTLAAALAGGFESQLTGKRYDLAVMGRRAANATFGNPRAADGASQVMLAMDLSPLVANSQLDVADFVTGLIRQFEAEVLAQLRQNLPQT